MNCLLSSGRESGVPLVGKNYEARFFVSLVKRRCCCCIEAKRTKIKNMYI
uniref:Predicted protein n=1 Tax=Hordeum vulgare subsp. vulgare TaxID=112509 RepID=F2E5S2_HORVV|nr:predicted protein [Hordeum vulgare subsp. vulgare]